MQKNPGTSQIMPRGEGKDSSGQEPALSKFFKQVFTLEKPDSNIKNSINQDFSDLEGRIIRRINVSVLDLFGTSVYDTLMQPSSWLSKAGNMLHINTRDWLIKYNILFEEGDPLDPFQLEESERILRQNDHIYDSRIFAIEAPDSKDSVDVYVLVQDIWSLSGNASVNKGIDQGFVSLKDINFLGLGTEVGTKVKFSDQYYGNWSWDGNIMLHNINRTFFSGRLSRRSEYDGSQWGVGINRDFFSPIIKWAGGIDMDWIKQRFWTKIDTTSIQDQMAYAKFDVWAGLATDFIQNNLPTMNKNKFNFSVRITRTDYSEVPDIDSSSFQNNTFLLSRFGYSHKRFYEDRYMFGLGRTEDIPVGFIAAVLYGFETGKQFERPYYGFYSGYSKFDYKLGYLYAGLQLGAFRQAGSWINSVTGLNLMFISKLMYGGQFKWRHYIWSRFSHTENPMGSFLTIDNDQGLRGSGTPKRGNKKIVVNYENNFFTPLSILGFNIAFISFADLALIAERNESLFNSKLYQGFGLGFRVRNEHLVAGTIQIMFGYYPGSNKFNAFEQSRSFYKFDEFRFSKPGMIDY